MKPGEYIVIKVADIEERIDEIRMIKDSGMDINSIFGRIRELEKLLETAKDLYDVVEASYNRGRFDVHCKEFDPENYLNNLEI